MRHRTLTLPLPALALLLATAAQAQTEYYRHSVFDNSLQRDFYYYSFAQATAPSSLEGKTGRLPVDSVHSLSPPCIYDLIDSSFEFGCVSSICLGCLSLDTER
jgi:hypothetical protein